MLETISNRFVVNEIGYTVYPTKWIVHFIASLFFFFTFVVGDGST